MEKDEKERLRKNVEFLLEEQSFQVAKTMPDSPHSYTLRRNWGERQKYFENVAQFIREFGTKEKFGGRTYSYYYFNGHKYWTMGAPLSETILINRAEVSQPHKLH